ncbi:Multidrug resistance-associated protein 4 [Coemansia spiralis]|nr:Multidrug resistance-associated protein 4 [Coemansia spiralis]
MAADSNPAQRAGPKQDIPATRLFKVLNPELFMKPNRLIMYGGVAAMAGIALWLGSAELKHRQEKGAATSTAGAPGALEQPLTYQEKMAELKRRSM